MAGLSLGIQPSVKISLPLLADFGL